MNKKIDKNGITVVSDYSGKEIKYGKVKTDAKPMSTYEKAQKTHKLKN